MADAPRTGSIRRKAVRSWIARAGKVARSSCAIRSPPSIAVRSGPKGPAGGDPEQPLEHSPDDGGRRGGAVPALLHQAHHHVLRMIGGGPRPAPRIGLLARGVPPPRLSPPPGAGARGTGARGGR